MLRWEAQKVDDFDPRELIAFRKARGMTVEEMSHALGVTFSTLSRWENGRAKPSKMGRRLIEEYMGRHEPVSVQK
jgi:DNA-binding transcriptional regulator YiaG